MGFVGDTFKLFPSVIVLSPLSLIRVARTVSVRETGPDVTTTGTIPDGIEVFSDKGFKTSVMSTTFNFN